MDRYEEHPAMFKNNPFGFIICLLLIAVAGLGIIILLYWWLKCRSQKLVIDSGELLWEQGILSKDRTEVRLSNVRTVKVQQSFGQRIMGTGNIEVFTAGDTPEVVVTGMPDPNKVRDLIKQGSAG